MFVIKHRIVFLLLSGFFVLVSLVVIFVGGLQFSIDFTGGSILEVLYTLERSPVEDLEAKLLGEQFTDFVIQPIGEKGVLVRTEILTDKEHSRLLEILGTKGETPFVEKRSSLVGGVVGEELRGKAWIALVLTSLAIILYIAFAFRKVSEGVSSWVYGMVAVAALIHNIIIPTGVFAILGHYFIEYQIDILFITALLAIFGFSVNDTIVIFDRVRENLRHNKENRENKTFDVIVGESIEQTLTRSINISLAIALVLTALYFLGAPSTREFSFVLGLGVLFGTYSSICFAAPLLVWFESRKSGKA